MSPVIPWIILLAGLALLPRSLSHLGRLRLAGILLLLATVAPLGEMTFSALLFVFRYKELILCQPLIYLIMGLSISLWVGFASTRLQQTAKQVGR